MIFERLHLENFRGFPGAQKLVLEPAARSRPVVLVSGPDGSGKTSLLEAIRLTLYGKRAAPASRRGGTYADYLRGCIHRHANPYEGASLRLEFCRPMDDAPRHYRVERSWCAMGEKVYEDLRVSVDGSQSPELSQHWDEHVESLLPLALADLFLFDAREIREQARQRSPLRHLERAFQEVLGLGLVDRLVEDLETLEKKKVDQCRVAPQEVARLKHAIADKTAELQQAQSALSEAKRRLHQRSKYFALLDDQLRHSAPEIHAERRRLEARLRETLEQVAELERQRARRPEGDEKLTDRDRKIVSFLRARRVAETVVAELEEMLSEHSPANEAPAGGDASEASASRLDSLRDEVQRQEERLRDVGDDRELAGIIDRRHRAMQRLDQARRAVEERQGSVEQVRRAVDQLDNRLAELVVRQVDDGEAIGVCGPLVHGPRLKGGLERFRSLLVEESLGRLERLIFDSLIDVAESNTPVEEVRVAPDNLDVSLLDAAGSRIDETELTNGQCQVVGTAVRWGLARALGRMAPTLIDNPLADINTDCGTQIVERFFGRFKSQLVLLDAPEAFTQYHGRLRAMVSHRYVLRTDAEADGTYIERDRTV